MHQGPFPSSQQTARIIISPLTQYQVLASCLTTLETKPIKVQFKQDTHKYCTKVVLTHLNMKEK